MQATKTADDLAAECRTQLATLTMLKQLRSSDDLLRRTAAQYITLHEQWQKAKYGKVRTRLSISKLLR